MSGSALKYRLHLAGSANAGDIDLASIDPSFWQPVVESGSVAYRAPPAAAAPKPPAGSGSPGAKAAKKGSRPRGKAAKAGEAAAVAEEEDDASSQRASWAGELHRGVALLAAETRLLRRMLAPKLVAARQPAAPASDAPLAASEPLPWQRTSHDLLSFSLRGSSSVAADATGMLQVSPLAGSKPKDGGLADPSSGSRSREVSAATSAYARHLAFILRAIVPPVDAAATGEGATTAADSSSSSSSSGSAARSGASSLDAAPAPSPPFPANLLTAGDRALATGILDLSPQALCLLARCLNRRGPWFRVVSFESYTDLAGAIGGELAAMAAPAGAQLQDAATGAAAGAAPAPPTAASTKGSGRLDPALLQAIVHELVASGMLLPLHRDVDGMERHAAAVAAVLGSSSGDVDAVVAGAHPGVMLPKPRVVAASWTSPQAAALQSLQLDAVSCLCSVWELKAICDQLHIKPLIAAAGSGSAVAAKPSGGRSPGAASVSPGAAGAGKFATAGASAAPSSSGAAAAPTRSDWVSALCTAVRTQRGVDGGPMPLGRAVVRALGLYVERRAAATGGEAGADGTPAAVASGLSSSRKPSPDSGSFMSPPPSKAGPAGATSRASSSRPASGGLKTPAPARGGSGPAKRSASSGASTGQRTLASLFSRAASAPSSSAADEVIEIVDSDDDARAASAPAAASPQAPALQETAARQSSGPSPKAPASWPPPPEGYLAVRMSDRVVSLVRRVHALFYIVTATAHVSSGMGTGAWPAPRFQLHPQPKPRRAGAGGASAAPPAGSAAAKSLRTPAKPTKQAFQAAGAATTSGVDSGASSDADDDNDDGYVSLTVQSALQEACIQPWDPAPNGDRAVDDAAAAGTRTSPSHTSDADIVVIDDDDECMVDGDTGHDAARSEAAQPSWLAWTLAHRKADQPSALDTAVEAATSSSGGVDGRASPGTGRGAEGSAVGAASAAKQNPSSQPASSRTGHTVGSRWQSAGSGSKYADSAALQDSFLPPPQVLLFGSAGADGLIGGASAGGGGVGYGASSGLFSPGLMTLFRKLRFEERMRVNTLRQVFGGRRDYAVFHLAHMVRACADASGLLSQAPMILGPSSDDSSTNPHVLDGLAAFGPATSGAAGAVAGGDLPASKRRKLGEGGGHEARAAAAVVAMDASRSDAVATPAVGISAGASVSGSKRARSSAAGLADSASTTLRTGDGSGELPISTLGSILTTSAAAPTFTAVTSPAGFVSDWRPWLLGHMATPYPPLAGLALLPFAPLLCADLSTAATISAVGDAWNVLWQSIGGAMPRGAANNADGDSESAPVVRILSAVSELAAPGVATHRGNCDFGGLSSAIAGFASVAHNVVGARACAAVVAAAAPALLSGLSSADDASSSSSADALTHALLDPEGCAFYEATGRALLHVAAAADGGLPAAWLLAMRASLCTACCVLMEASAMPPTLLVHPWLFQLSPAAVFATLVWECIDTLERSKLHHCTIPLLLQLTTLPFTPHRSGRWWVRLCLNLDLHCGRPQDALQAAAGGLSSPGVRAGERLDLRRRYGRMCAKLGVVPRSAPAEVSASQSSVVVIDGQDCDGAGSDQPFAAPPHLRASLPPQLAVTVAASTSPSAAELPAAPAPIASPMNDPTCAVEATGTGPTCVDAFGHPLWHWPAVQAALDGSSDASIDRALAARIVAASVTVDTFVRAPLNSVVGQKSRFLADYDHANDGDDSMDAGVASSSATGSGTAVVPPPSSVVGSSAAAAAAPPPPARIGTDGFDDLDELLADQADWDNHIDEAQEAGLAQVGASPRVEPQPPHDDAQQDDEREESDDDDNDDIDAQVDIDFDAGPASGSDAIALGDTANDIAPSDPTAATPINITDAVCEAFGWRYDPRNPGRHVYTPPAGAAGSAAGAASSSSSSGGGGFEREWAPASVSVEQLALAYYHENGGWRGLHCEGGPLISLCTLLHWDVLFDGDTPDTFITPYQDAPLDIDVPGVYYSNRAAALQARWRQIAGMDRDALAAELQRVWLLHEGTVCRGMPWRHYPLQLLQLIAVGMGGPALACICDALAFNRKQFGSGLPDLMLWRVTASAMPAVESGDTSAATGSGGAAAGATGAAGDAPSVVVPWLPRHARVEVVYSEVKGPRDSLSEKQEVWLRLLSQSGVRAALCRIVEKVKEPRLPKPKREPPAGKGKGKGAKKAH